MLEMHASLQGLVAILAEDDFALEPGGAEIQELTLKFPENTSDAWYGLGLFVQRPGGPCAGVTYLHSRRR